MSSPLQSDNLTVLGIATLLTVLLPIVSGEFKTDNKSVEPQLRGADGAKAIFFLFSILFGYLGVGGVLGACTGYNLVFCFWIPMIVGLGLSSFILWLARKYCLNETQWQKKALGRRLKFIVLYCFLFLLLGISIKAFTTRAGKIYVTLVWEDPNGNDKSLELNPNREYSEKAHTEREFLAKHSSSKYFIFFDSSDKVVLEFSCLGRRDWAKLIEFRAERQGRIWNPSVNSDSLSLPKEFWGEFRYLWSEKKEALFQFCRTL